MDSLAPLPYPVHINVNVSLDLTLDAHVRALNREVVGRGFKEVCFGEPGLHIPHITLLRGTLESVDHLRQLREAVSQLASSKAPFAFTVGELHWSARSGQYIFLPVLPQRAFNDLSQQLYQCVERFFVCGETGGPQIDSHVTVGYADRAGLSLSEFSWFSPPCVCLGSELRICTAGARGTCTSVISRAPLLAGAGPGPGRATP